MRKALSMIFVHISETCHNYGMIVFWVWTRVENEFGTISVGLSVNEAKAKELELGQFKIHLIFPVEIAKGTVVQQRLVKAVDQIKEPDDTQPVETDMVNQIYIQYLVIVCFVSLISSRDLKLFCIS